MTFILIMTWAIAMTTSVVLSATDGTLVAPMAVGASLIPIAIAMIRD